MKNLFIFLLFLFSHGDDFAQKLLIDTSVYGKWVGVNNFIISNDGKYLIYDTSNQSVNRTVIVKSLNSSWKKEFTDTYEYQYSFKLSDDSKQLYLADKDSLCIITLGSDEVKVILHSTLPVSIGQGSSWLAYQLNTPEKVLIVMNKNTGQKQTFGHIADFRFVAGGSALLLQKDIGCAQIALQWVNLANSEIKTIWEGTKPEGLIFNQSGNRLIFMSRDSVKTMKSLWIYNQEETKAISLKLDSRDKSLEVNNLSNFQFDHTGNRLFFVVDKPIDRPRINPSLASVDVYGYKDPKLQSDQLNERQKTHFSYAYNFSTQKVFRLENENDEIRSPLNGDWVLIRHYGTGDFEEWNWNKEALSSIYLVSTNDGSRKLLVNNVADPLIGSFKLAPTGKYVVWYNPIKKSYFSYDTKSGVTSNIAKGLKIDWNDAYCFESDWLLPDEANVVGWTPGDTSVWLKNSYDLFQVDPRGKRPPINLTNSYGLKHHIKFTVYSPQQQYQQTEVIQTDKPVLLHFINEENKNEGFCTIRAGRQQNPVFLSTFPKRIDNFLQKAGDAQVYAFSMQDEKSAPNWYLTKDFKTFSQVTNVQPHKNYNWLTAELIKWKTPDGNITQGVLYKPENFDPKKKYPVIFHFYETKSDGLHKYYAPVYQSGGSIDIPTYVSNGYLVFLPDIHYQIGYPGKSALNTIISAAKYLSKYSWVNPTKMGLMGHSFGGYETNYVITHSHLFAAAIAMSSENDFVSFYGSLRNGGRSSQNMFEYAQNRIFATLWQRPDLYIENSPIFKVEKVTTPVLLMANKGDDIVPYSQGIEFFSALRRLNKKSWLLQYDHGTHMAGSVADDKDYTIRSRQFFDYYLKGIPPPKWMVEGIPASQKQVGGGFEADTTGKKP